MSVNVTIILSLESHRIPREQETSNSEGQRRGAGQVVRREGWNSTLSQDNVPGRNDQTVWLMLESQKDWVKRVGRRG